MSLPTKEELPTRYNNLVDSIVDIVMGNKITPTLLHYLFYKKLSYLLFKQTKTWTPYSNYLIRNLLDNILCLESEEVKQQLNLNILEIYNFYKMKEKNKAMKIQLYDYLRFNLIKIIAVWLVDQIKTKVADFDEFIDDPLYCMKEPETKRTLGWLLIRNDSKLSELSVFKRYILYLRYSKGLSLREISSLTNRHVKMLEKDFVEINYVLKEIEHAREFYA